MDKKTDRKLMSNKVNIEPEWGTVLSDFFSTDKFAELSDFIRKEYQSKTIYPRPENLFKAFWLTPFSKVKVVILGQDPYHGPKQAHGLCFSVPEGIPVPPSLQNIYKEIEKDLDVKIDFKSGSLEGWASQGVFLLNAILTVVAGSPASHRSKGWEEFTDHIIKAISDSKENIVFLLWGNYARGKKYLIDANKHLVLEAPHPSPFSVHSGFFGCRHFSKANDYLREHGQKDIDWQSQAL